MTSRARLVGAVAALCLAMVAALLSGCSGPGDRGHGSSSAVRGIGAALDRRAHAVLHHDRAAFLGTVDPAATGFKAAQATVFDNLRKLPLSAWSYKVRSTGVFQVADGQEVAAKVELDYALRGYDTAPVSSDAYLTMALRDGHWYVASQTGGEGAGDHTTVQPWDQGPLTVVNGSRSLVIGQGSAAVLRAYARLADRAVPVVNAAWPGKWARRAVVEVPGSESGLAALLGGRPDEYRGIAAVTTAELGSTARMPADRVIANPDAFKELSPLGRRVVLTHEMTHVATDTATSSGTPLWLSEGFADWVGYTGTGRTPRQVAPELRHDVLTGHAPTRLPTTADFGMTASGLPQAYEQGWLACRMVAVTWGHAKLVALYRETGTEGLDKALRDTLGLTTAQFTARWRAYVERELA